MSDLNEYVFQVVAEVIVWAPDEENAQIAVDDALLGMEGGAEILIDSCRCISSQVEDDE